MKSVGIAAIILYLLYFGLAYAMDLKITWDANTEADLGGYNISYDSPSSDRWVTPCGPYEVSSLGVGYNTTYTIEDVAPGDYALYIRAYDINGLMSDYTAIAGNLSEAGVWSTVGISEPTNCVPDAIITTSTTTGISPKSIIFSASESTNDPTMWHWWIPYTDGDETYDFTTEEFTTNAEGMLYVRLRTWNSTWFDDDFVLLYITRQPSAVNVTFGAGCGLH